MLWDEWEDFITGGIDGEDTSTLPLWQPSVTTYIGVGSLWDYLGYVPDVIPTATSSPLMFPRTAYNLIYNEFYRDENLQEAVLATSVFVLNRNWEKDYFTSSLPWQQRGTAPALPISGTTSAKWLNTHFHLLLVRLIMS